ncbi:MAG: DUF4058 family protein [Symploca sp. SIO2C1]|nr:DUF4058 family protein [Symploca sp. SIO2C1]
MASSFPGMNPYLEHPSLWTEVHSWLIVQLARFLNPSLIPKYRAAVEKRVYLDSLLVGIPDVSVFSGKAETEPNSGVTTKVLSKPVRGRKISQCCLTLWLPVGDSQLRD